MDIRVCRSVDWTGRDWESYCESFNEVFHREFTVDYFRHKYLSVYRGYACHALLYSEEGMVVGGMTVIPCYYRRDGERFVNGLAVDVFICESYRSDPLMLRRMYKKLILLLEEEHVVAVIAVPNATAYPYWKNVVKWKVVGIINYWALPVRMGRILGKTGLAEAFLNTCSRFYCLSLSLITFLCSFIDTKDKSYRYRICADDPYYVSKFDGKDYHRGEDGVISYLYKLEDENGVRTGYLLDAEESGGRSFKAIRKAVSMILRQDVDLVLYVGKLSFFQTLLMKMPRKLEPKLLPFTCDLISKDERYKDMLNFEFWDFGLRNYDVR